LLLDAEIFRRLMMIKADLFHAHNYEAALICHLVGRIRGIPVVYDAHGILSEELPTYFPRESGRSRALAVALGRRVDRLLAGVDGVIAISAEGERRLRGLGAQKIWRIPPGVEPEEYQGVEVGKAEQPTVVYAGNPDSYQDLPILFDAMRLLPDVRLRILSHSPDWRIPSDVRADIQQVKSWEDARCGMASAWVAALPRRSCPGFPIKLLNYLGLGLPTVISRGSSQGLPGEIPVEPEPLAFAAAIRSAIKDAPPPFQQQFLAENAWSRRVEDILAVYRALRPGSTS
jgi:glycosyltransferase involved in cell wall biosynthesis